VTEENKSHLQEVEEAKIKTQKTKKIKIMILIKIR
jgi:hypothetical protein